MLLCIIRFVIVVCIWNIIHLESNERVLCNKLAIVESKKYFDEMSNIYSNIRESTTCIGAHKQCGWPSKSENSIKLPLFVLTVGLEGAGHHFWTEKLRFEALILYLS